MINIRKHLLFFALKTMGVKSIFSQAPVNYLKLRKSDQKCPPKRFLKSFDVQKRTMAQSEVTIVSPRTESAPLKRAERSPVVLFLHGGAFISGPTKLHWDTIETIVKQTSATVWLVDYPKAPEFTIDRVNENIDQVYENCSKESERRPIILGDSAGATLAMSLCQRLVSSEKALPSKLVLITPVFDSSLSNDDIDRIDSKDPMLSKPGLLSAKQMAAGDCDLKDPSISPLYGDFKGFPHTLLLLGGADILCPDGVLGAAKMKRAGVEVDVVHDENMPHVFPLLPLVSDVQDAMSRILASIET